MGMWFSTIQIQNRNQTDQEGFGKILSKHMKKAGWLPAAEDEAQCSCSFVFSKNNNWITLSSDGYEPITEMVLNDAQGLAKTMKTVCILTSVMASDEVSFDCFGAAGEKEDRVQVGEYGGPDNDCPPENANPEFWKPLLAEGYTWEQLLEIWNDDEYVCKEGLFWAIAPLLGMDSANICADYRIMEEDDFDTVTLHYKKDAPMFITEGPTKLVCPGSGGDASGLYTFSFYNIGGISKGLGVLAVGDCIHNGEVELSDLIIDRRKDPMKMYKERGIPKMSDYKNDYVKYTAPWDEFILPDGRTGLWARFPDFEFLSGINMDNPAMRGKKGNDIRCYHSCVGRIKAKVLSGVEHKFDIYLCTRNWADGQVRVPMNVYSKYGS